jgi:hypothetical protein
LACGECHFASYADTAWHTNKAAFTVEPHIFGAVLHQLQDYYSHWGEGYHDQVLGHGLDSAATVDRGEFKLDVFFENCHKWNNGLYEMCLTPNYFPAHPRDDVLENIKQRNPGIDLSNLTDWDLVDLYLRADGSNPPSEERAYFGFKPDNYVETSSRDRFMEIDKRPPDAKMEVEAQRYLTW